MMQNLMSIKYLFKSAFTNRITNETSCPRIRISGSIAVLLNSPSLYNEQGTLDFGSLLMKCMNIERPYPMRMLKIGPAMVPVIAISPKFFLVMATSALISPRQFPHAKIVNANRDLGRVVIKANNCNRSRIISELNLIHRMLYTKARIEYVVINHAGASETFVLNLTIMPRIAPGIKESNPIYKYKSLGSSM